MVKEIDNIELARVYEKTPKDIKVILNSEMIKDELLAVLSKYDITEKQKVMFFKEILAVSLLVTSKKNFIDNITEILDITSIEANRIGLEVEKIIFDRIRQVNEGLSSDFLNIDNNIDFFSNNEARQVELPEELYENFDIKLNYDKYELIKIETKSL